MKKLLLFGISLVVVLVYGNQVCKDDEIEVSGVCQQNDVKLPRDSYKINDVLSLHYEYQNEDTIIFVATSKSKGAFALGLGDNGMTNADMVVFELINANQIKLTDRWSKQKESPKEDTEYGCTNDYKLLGYSVTDSLITVKYSRKLNTGDTSCDIVIQPNTQNNFVWAYSDKPTLGYHSKNRGRISIVLETKNQWYDIYGKFQFFLWAVALDVVIVIARYLRGHKYYANIHGFLMICIFISSLIVEVFVIVQGNQPNTTGYGKQTHKDVHFYSSIAVLGLALIQIIGGLTLNSLRKSEADVDPLQIQKNKAIHRLSGIILSIAAKANVALGFSIYQPDFTDILVYYYTVLAIVWVVANLVIRSLKDQYAHNVKEYPSEGKEEFVNQTHKTLLRLLHQGESTLKIEQQFPTLIYVTIGNRVYDVSNLDHPGGRIILEKVKGRDIERFFFGGYPIEFSKMKSHLHSKNARNILEKFYIGEYEPKEGFIILPAFKRQSLLSNINSSLQPGSVLVEPLLTTNQLVQHTWSLVQKNFIENNQSIILFQFESDNYSVKLHPKTLNFFGKHFIVTDADGLYPPRPYTILLCYTAEQIQIRNLLLANTQEFIETGNIPSNLLRYDFYSRSERLPLIIKNYGDYSGLSRHIHEQDINRKPKFYITGQSGVGLQLDANSNGEYAIFCAGTGILPFLDLFDFLIKKICYQILQERDPVIAEKIMPNGSNEFGNKFGPRFKVRLFASFSSKQDFVCRSVVTELEKLCRKYEKETFECVIRYNDNSRDNYFRTTVQKFGTKFMKDQVPAYTEKIYICGSPNFNREIPQSLVLAGYDESRFVFV